MGYLLQMHIPPGTSLSVMAVRRGAFQTETSYAILVNYIAYLFIANLYLVVTLTARYRLKDYRLCQILNRMVLRLSPTEGWH